MILTNKTVQENTDKQTQYKSEKVNNLKYSKTNYPGSVASYNSRPGNEVGLFYNAPEPTPDTGGQCVNVPRINTDMMVDDMLLELTQSLSYYHGVCSLLAAVRV